MRAEVFKCWSNAKFVSIWNVAFQIVVESLNDLCELSGLIYLERPGTQSRSYSNFTQRWRKSRGHANLKNAAKTPPSDFKWSNHSHRLMFLSLPLLFVLLLNPDWSSCLKGSEFYESILCLPCTNSHENTEICMADRQFSLIYAPFEVYYTVWFPWWANLLPTGELSCWMSPVSSIRNHQHHGP